MFDPFIPEFFELSRGFVGAILIVIQCLIQGISVCVTAVKIIKALLEAKNFFGEDFLFVLGIL